MIIMFPTNENIGLQAMLVEDFNSAKFYTLIRINKKGAVLSVSSISNEEVDQINPYAIVSLSEINNIKYKDTPIYIDEYSKNVDNALVKVLQEKLFNKAS